MPNNFHQEILTAEQVKLLPLIAKFSADFGLVGGTAIAFHLGHRRSIDFDLFAYEKFGNQGLLNKILEYSVKPDIIIVNKLGELTLTIYGVKITFYKFPYKIDYSENLPGIIHMPNLLTLAAMKAFALGQRSKWKDYVDMYFILSQNFSITEVSQAGKEIFGTEFNEKLFRTQLGYFDDMNYTEQVEFLPGFAVEDELVKKKLIEFSLE